MTIFLDKSRRLCRRGPTTKSGQKGFSLIITFFIMIIVLAVVLSISAILYSEVKVIRNIGNSMISLYAADSGLEKFFYYDGNVLPAGGARGFCYMLDASNPNYCRADQAGAPDHSIYCNNPEIAPLNQVDGGCDINSCSSCKISFDTTFDKRVYYVEAKVDTANSLYLDITSSGAFGGAGRKIEIVAPLRQSQ